ncbi:hypothetical protein HK096_005428 [Nowakowskiella sp. JEL0078]|nr:hypothetical protein HK096_005428 [Nowakowskiella sp. JEL0078]
MLAESTKLYKEKVEPYIESLPQSKIKWVYNILERKSETESIVEEDSDPETGYVVLPDMKWNSTGKPDQFYLQMLINRRDLRSMRDLKGSDLPFLKSLQQKISDIVLKNFAATGVQKNQICSFLHYPPIQQSEEKIKIPDDCFVSDHFHIHITSLFLKDSPAIKVGRTHFLDTVISNLEIDPEFYQKATMHYVVDETHPLWKLCGDETV